MRTAREMYQYCVDNKYGQGMSSKWDVKHFSIIENTLNSNEEVIMCFEGLHNYESVSKHEDNYAYAITNRRIILAQQKLFGQVVKTIDIEMLNDITVNSGILVGIITIDTLKERFNVAVNKQVAENINRRIHDALLEVKQQNKLDVNNQMISAADEILKYKKLLDAGIITMEEFEIKKKQLLGI